MSCTVEGCDSPTIARGWCSRHYQRWQRHGSTDEPARPALDHAALFAAKTVRHDSGCLMWVGARSSSGYGVLTVQQQSVLAHRYALQLAGVVVPEGYHVDHLCRVRLCVEPSHLEPVTQAENNRRAALARRRSRDPT